MKKVILLLSILLSNYCFGQKLDFYVQDHLLGRGEVFIIDSCINCLSMGLTEEEWEIKDRPFWRKIDSVAIAENGIGGGLYMGDLPSSMCCSTWGGEVNGKSYMEIQIYHPSIDSTIYEKHYFIYNTSFNEKYINIPDTSK